MLAREELALRIQECIRAYEIVKTIFEKRDDLIAVHKEAEQFKLENQKAAASPVPFHPGAVKYFTERGLKF